jgi:hypothetical protein
MFKNLPDDPLGMIKFILAFGIIVYVLWLMTGGMERVENREKPFLQEPAPLDSGEVYGLDEI